MGAILPTGRVELTPETVGVRWRLLLVSPPLPCVSALRSVNMIPRMIPTSQLIDLPIDAITRAMFWLIS